MTKYAWIRELGWPHESGTYVVSTSDHPGGYVYEARPSGNSPLSDASAFERAEQYLYALCADGSYEVGEP